MVKAADSPWKLNDRSNNWLKIKPEYVEVQHLCTSAHLTSYGQNEKHYMYFYNRLCGKHSWSIA